MRLTLTTAQKQAVKKIHRNMDNANPFKGKVRIQNDHVICTDSHRVLFFALKNRVPDGVYDIGDEVIALTEKQDQYITLKDLRSIMLMTGKSFTTYKDQLASDLERVMDFSSSGWHIAHKYIHQLGDGQLTCFYQDGFKPVVVTDGILTWAIMLRKGAPVPDVKKESRTLEDLIGEVKYTED